jgi:NOL1/NOP2/fmu family ribosome biogenesis protein
MFRKNSRAIEEWSEENVKMCAERQREILENVAKCVKKGGKLLYSTCTFAPEENEENVAWFLDNHPDFALVKAEDALICNSSDGVMLDGCEYDMTLCRRIYPYRSNGEGQFIAVFERREGGFFESERPKKDKKQKGADGARKNRAELDSLAAARDFLKKNLTVEPDGELIMLGEMIFLSPRIALPAYNVFAAGVCVGECVKGRIVPHHQLFSACGREFKLKLELSSHDDRVKRYLRGEEIGCSEELGERSGWCAVMIDGCCVGGAKVSSGVAKNHYPKGLRTQCALHSVQQAP